MTNNKNGKEPDRTAMVCLKAPLMLPDGSEITEALFGGYKIVQSPLPVQVPKQVMRAGHIITEMAQGVAMLQMPVGLIALLVPVGGENIEVAVPISDVRLLVNIADYAKLENKDATSTTADN